MKFETPPPDLDNDALVTPAKAARLLQVHPATLYRWILTGKLPAWKRGSRMLVKRADLDGLLERVVPLAERPRLVQSTRERRANDRKTMDILKRAGIA